LRHLRGLFAAYARHRWDLEVLGAEHVPMSGPAVFVANHIGFLDGPLMAIVGPRPVHALTKHELFSGAMGAFLHFSGQIAVDRFAQDPRAIRLGLRVLRQDGAVGMFPETTRGAGDMATVAGGAAYLSLVTGAPLVPTAFLGTRLAGSAKTFPPRGSRVVMAYGEPLRVAPRPWPRRPAQVHALTGEVRQAVVHLVRETERATGMTLPGPLPVTAASTGEDNT
jgi:1-acyl-sn-glycerol-3-phosphate acyltransferase